MAEPVTVILGSIVVALVSGAAGKYLGSNGKVKENQCEERRDSCVILVGEKIDNLTRIVNKLEKAVNNKLLGL